MKLNELSDNKGARTDRMRVGRGPGSGKGRTAGRGMNGQKSRSGVSLKGFEGGQMPLYRRLPKRGFKNPFRKNFAVINTGRLQRAIDEKRIDPKKKIDTALLIATGLIGRRVGDGVRLLAKGELKTKITIGVDGASKSAVAAVEKAGGTVELPAPKPEAEKVGKKAAKKAAREAAQEANRKNAGKEPAKDSGKKAAGKDSGKSDKKESKKGSDKSDKKEAVKASAKEEAATAKNGEADEDTGKAEETPPEDKN